MQVAISSTGDNLEAPVSAVFGRCPSYVFVDTETMQASATANPAISASGGAGVQAAQFVARQGAEAVVSGNYGPNALQALLASGVTAYTVAGGTVREAVEALLAGELQAVGSPTVGKDYGKGGSGIGGGRGAGRGR